MTITVSLLTQPTDAETLKNFYRKVQPAGFWAPVKQAVLEEQTRLSKSSFHFAVEFFNTVVAMIGITALYVSMLYLVLHRLTVGFGLLGDHACCGHRSLFYLVQNAAAAGCGAVRRC